MSIIVNRQPQPYTPAYSPVIYHLTSNRTNLVYFTVQINDDGSNISTQRYYTMPSLQFGAVFDISSVLSNYVSPQILSSNNILEPVENIYQSYNLYITENYVYNGDTVTGSTFSTDVRTVYGAELGRVSFSSYDYTKYVISSTGASGSVSFLTDRPNFIKTHFNAPETLYLLNDGLTTLTVDYKLYDHHNYYIGHYSFTQSSIDTKALRVNSSPKFVADYFNVDFTNVKNYSVQVFAGNTPKTKLITYQYEDLRCIEEPVYIVFSNAWGGFDCWTFYNPRESMNVQKTVISQYPYKLDGNLNYTDITNSVYNAETQVINTTATSTYTVVSKPLKDDESTFLKQLIKATDVYVYLSDGTYLPIVISTTSYNVGRIKYSSQLIRLEIQFTTTSGIDVINKAPVGIYNPPNIPYIEVEGFCYDTTDGDIEFGYITPDSDGDAEIEDGQ